MENNDTHLSYRELYQAIADQTSSIFHYSSGVLLLLGNLGSLFTNGSVLFVFMIKDKNLLTRTNLYIASICLLSLLMAVFGTPMVVSSCFYKSWLFGDIGCQYYGFLMSFGGLSSMLILCMISIDRYIYVVRSGLSVHLSTKVTLIAVSICMVLSFGIACGPLVGWNQYIYEGVGTACAIDLIGDDGESFVLTLLVVYFSIPVAIMVFTYGSIYAKVIKESKAHMRSSIRQPVSKETSKKWGMEKELAVTVTLIIGFFLLCYSPYAFLLLWKLLNKNTEVDPIVMAVPSMITKTGGVFTPLVYLARNNAFRMQVLNMYPCFRKRNAVNPEMSKAERIANDANTVVLSLQTDAHGQDTLTTHANQK